MWTGSVVAPLRALIVALGGVFLAWLWYKQPVWMAMTFAALALLLSFFAYRVGRRFLPGHPRLAMSLMSGGLAATEAVLATVAAAVVIVIAVTLTVPAKTPAGTKELIGSLSTGVTAFIAAVFISRAGDPQDTSVGDRIAADFRRKYKRAPAAGETRESNVHYFQDDSTGERLVYGDEVAGISGWSASARKKRAAKLADELKSGSSNA